MDSTVFDDLARSVSERLTRRRLARLAGAGVVSAAVAPALGEAKKHRNKQAEAEHNVRGNKAIMCFEGETMRVTKDKRKKWLRKGATRGKCGGTCTPTCLPGGCGDDGCGGTCPGCAAGSVCAEGVCQACLVSCDVRTEKPKECGATLRAALKTGGDIYVCPGVYEGPFEPPVSANIYGAGTGTDTTTNTILTGSDFTQIMDIEAPITVTLASLRFTNGNATYGAGVYIDDPAANVTVTDCIFTQGYGEYGEGIYKYTGSLTVNNCQFIDNKGDYSGTGVYNENGPAAISNSTFSGNISGEYGGAICNYGSGTTTVSGCTITGNTAVEGGGIAGKAGVITVSDTTISSNTAEEGGGVYVDGGTVTLAANVSVTGNTATDPAPSGGGVFVDRGTFNRNGATISGNTPDQCVGAGC